MTALEILKAARERIANPENWLQGDFALTADGEKTNEDSPYATKFCAVGAIYADEPYNGFESAFALAEAIETLHYTDLAFNRTRPAGAFVSDWNDKPERKHSEVLAAYDLAIAMQASV